MTKRNLISTLVMLSITAGSSYYYYGQYIPNMEKEKRAMKIKEAKDQKEEALRLAYSVMPLDMANFREPEDGKIVLSSKKMLNLENISKEINLNKITEISLSNVNYGDFLKKISKENSIKSLTLLKKIKKVEDARKEQAAKENNANLFPDSQYSKNKTAEKEKNIYQDVSFLSLKTEMELVDVENLNTLAPFSNLEDIKTLSLKNLSTSSLNELSSLKKVETLYISSKEVIDISALNSIKEGRVELDIAVKNLEKALDKNSYLCKSLNIFIKDKGSTNRVGGENYSSLCKESSYIEFNGGKRITMDDNVDLDFLKEEESLDLGSYEKMTINSKDIIRIKEVPYLVSLKNLELNTPKLLNLSFLDSIMGLETLVLKNMDIKKSHNFPNLDDLKVLVVENVKNIDFIISSFSASNKLKSLKVVNSNTEGIEGSFTNLEHLSIENSNISSISFLSKSKKLKTIAVYNTLVRTLEGLEGLEDTVLIDLRENSILADIGALKDVKKGEVNIDNKNFLRKINKNAFICKTYPKYCTGM